MARKKRTTSIVASAQANDLLVYNTGLYGRLSVLDNGKVDGDSLESQIALMEQYVTQRPYLRYTRLYQDNGFTGTNFRRPGWDELIRDVLAGKINCIVVKDLSRLGRNYIAVGEFLEKECPRLGVRFISINDGYDSANSDSNEELSTALKNIVNDCYAKDISQKVCSVLEGKRQRGEYIGSYAPYGYRKDPANKNHLIIDPITAPIVLQIYEWRAVGLGYGAITRRLNEQGIPSPGRYRFEQGIITNNNKKGTALLWNRHALTDILRNPVYIGHLAQGKCRASLYRGIPAHTTPKDEWDIVYHTHEPIMPEELFYAVQQVNEQQSAAYKANFGKYAHLPKETNPYREKLVCADCNTQLKLYRAIARGGKQAYYSYICPTFEEHRELRCTKKSIRSRDLDTAVLAALRTQIKIFLDAAETLSTILSRKMDTGQTRDVDSQRRRLEQQIERKTSLSASLYSDWKSGILSYEEYCFAKEKYAQDIGSLKRQMQEMESLSSCARERLTQIDLWKQRIAKCQEMETVTEALVDAFIHSIRLDSDGKISVHFSFEEEQKMIEREIKQLREVA